MFVKSSTFAALLATISLAASSPVEDKRAQGTINFVNQTPRDINYALVGPSGTVKSGTVRTGSYNSSGRNGTQALPLPPAGQGYSLKLSQSTPQAPTGILQFQYTRNSDNNIVYNWSALNGNSGEDPFLSYTRAITPSHEAGSCKAIVCEVYQGDTSCEATKAGQGPVGVCAASDGVVLTVGILGP